ncbi:MAG TPA: S9 family peptidase [Bryobacteraceae bacterium]|nr:S9 family peptidase [Bryobacteraceae bacterium]
MRLFPSLLWLGVAAVAAPWSLETLYTRPYVWGTPPSQLSWAKSSPKVCFLWNESGLRFLDLYCWDSIAKRRVRVTSFESVHDPWNPGADATDSRLRANRMPESGLASFSLSDDGVLAAFSWKGDVYWASTDGIRPPFRLTQTKAAETSPQLAPDGKRVAYARGGDIFVHDLQTGAIVQVAEGASAAFQFSPDGKRLLYSVPGGGGRTQILPNYSGRFVTSRSFSRTVAGDEPAPAVLYVVDAAGGTPVKLGEGSGPVWSPGSGEILVHSVSQDRKKGTYRIYSAATGKARTLYEERDERWVAQSFYCWSPDGKWVALTSDRTGYIHLYRIPAAGGVLEPITKGDWELDTERFGFDPQWAGGRIFYASTEAGTNERQYYSILPNGSGKTRISKREGINVGVVSGDGNHTALLEADLRMPLDLFVDGQRVTSSPRPGFGAYSWPETRFVEFPSRDGKAAVKAKILLPPGYNPARKDGKQWPSVFFIHGAGIASSVLKQWGSYSDLRFVYNAYLASQGSVVMDLDYRGSSGYGREWRTGVYLHMGGPDLDDVLGAVDYLRTLGNIDMQRIGIWGVSYGGFMTNMAMFQAPGVFRAGSSWAAVNDWENYNHGYTRERLTTPAENPEAYRRSSPITYSRNLKDHLLLVHGMVDSNVLFQDTVQLTEKLIQEGRPFEEIFYPQEDHGFVRDETWIDALRRTTAFFEKHLR